MDNRGQIVSLCEVWRVKIETRKKLIYLLVVKGKKKLSLPMYGGGFNLSSSLNGKDLYFYNIGNLKVFFVKFYLNFTNLKVKNVFS